MKRSRRTPAYAAGEEAARLGIVLEEGNPHWLDPNFWNAILTGVSKGAEDGFRVPTEPVVASVSDEEVVGPVAEALQEERDRIEACLNGRRIPPVFDDRSEYMDDRMQLDANRWDKRPTRFPHDLRGIARTSRRQSFQQ